MPRISPGKASVKRVRIRVSKRNLYCWSMAGLIPYFKIGRAVRFRKSELDAALERMLIG